MAINFPDSPNNGDSFTSNNKTWVFDGTVWNITSGTNSVADGAITAAKLASNAVHQTKLASNLSAITVTTTANRSTDVPSPFTGQTIFLTDVKRMQVWDGSAWIFVTNGAPGAPTSLSATALSTTSVSVSFTPGASAGASPINYKYSLSTNGGSTYGEPTALDPADITSPITISGLTSGQTYHIKLRAVSDFGDSLDSTATSIAVPELPSAPTSLSATPGTSTVSIAFTAGADGGSAITNYQYALSTNGGSSYGSFAALDPADATSPITISGLSQGTAYLVKLKAVSALGVGAESSAVSFTTIIVIEYLVVAGGGGGAGSDTNGAGNGGGGAGGYRSSVVGENSGRLSSAESVFTISTSTNYTVTIGGGGSGGAQANYTSGVVGANSVFATITSIGGGRGIAGSQGGTGGSGGAGNYGASARGLGTAGQGFDSGLVISPNSPYHAAGGGGAGAQGGDAVGTSYAGAGGNGIASSITGSSVYRAGGGGSGNINNSGHSAGGLGGGGTANGNGGTNLGGGGAGGGGRAGGSGGSGVVILRYSSNLTITLGAGLTGSTATVSSNKVTTITAGSGNVSWA
jgi:hypothetical protein